MTCFGLAFLGWVVHHCHTLLHFYPSLFLYFLLHPFIICLILFCLLLSPSNVVSLYERWVLWCTSPIVWRYSFGCRLSHLAHMILWYLALCTRVWHLVIGYLGLSFPSFHSPFTHGLHYGPSHKTTLRPWDLVSTSTRFIRTGSIYWLSTGCWQVSIASGNIKGHILHFHLVCLPRVHDQRQMIQRVRTVEGAFAWCFDMFILGHTPILACWLRLLHMYTGSSFCLEMFWISEFE